MKETICKTQACKDTEHVKGTPRSQREVATLPTHHAHTLIDIPHQPDRGLDSTATTRPGTGQAEGRAEVHAPC